MGKGRGGGGGREGGGLGREGGGGGLSGQVYKTIVFHNF
jgi:hypothetical protein